MTHEASLYENNCFITLTYSDKHLPYDGSLNVRTFQLFMKRLRKQYGDKRIRFFHCGEYGDQLERPHYHAILFNHDFEDKKVWKRNKQGDLVYTSQALSSLWGLGFCTLGDVTFLSAAYVARYSMKKITGEKAEAHYLRYIDGDLISLTPEYVTMSRRPGIGLPWLRKYGSDVYPSDEVIINGQSAKPPKFYDEQMEKLDPALFKGVKQRRKKGEIIQRWNNTDRRLRVRELCREARLRRLPR